MRLFLYLCLALLLLCSLPGSAALAAQMMPGLAASQTSAPADQAPVGEPSPNDVRELMRLLADHRVQAWLSRQASESASAAASAGGATQLGLQEWLKARLGSVERNAIAVAAAWSRPAERLAAFQRGWTGQMREGETLRSMVYVVVFLILGTGLEWLYWRYAWGIRRRIETAAERDGVADARGTAMRALLAAGGIALFALGSTGGFLIFDWAPLVEITVISLLLAVVLVRLVNTVAVFALCPRVAALRPFPISTPVARFVYWWMMAIVAVGCVGGLAAEASEEMGIVTGAGIMVASGTATAVAAMLVAAIWHARSRFSQHGVSPRRRVALPDLAPVAATLLVVLVWALWLVGARGFMWTLVILAALPLADWGCRKTLRASLGPSTIENLEAPEPGSDPGTADAAEGETGADSDAHFQPEGSPQETPVARAPRRQLYVPVLERLARFLLVVAAMLLLGTAWGFDLLTLSTSASVGGRLFEAAVDILVAVLIADLIWVWARTAIDSRMAGYKPPEPGHAPGPEARLATLLPLIRKVLMVTLLVMVVLVVLSSLGINVGPLLAGAGVVGIAIGFGAQTLVRDIVSGIFFLLDDAFRVGEYIEIGDLRGTVESISVRSLRLRHHRGAVHTIPFGEMKSLTNHSRDWVIMKLEFRVPFGTDLKMVKKLVKSIGEELAEDEEIGPSILEPLKSQGVRRMEEFNMVVGVKFMTKPGEQWQMRKEVYQRVRDAFESKGITFAERNVKVEVIGANPNSPEAHAAALGAAEHAIEQRMDPAAPGAARTSS